MIKITVIALAKLKEKYLCEAAEEYKKRLSRYCRLETIELEPERLREKPSDSEIEAALEKEAQKIIKKIPAGAFVTALCVEGRGMSSRQFSETLAAKCSAPGGMVFIIGSSYGLSDSVKRMADLRLSVSEMTFPHRLFRVMLLEQIYRAFKIIEGGEYDK